MSGVAVTIWYYNIGADNTFTPGDIQSLCSSIGATYVSP
jgi:hypothetical protein